MERLGRFVPLNKHLGGLNGLPVRLGVERFWTPWKPGVLVNHKLLVGRMPICLIDA